MKKRIVTLVAVMMLVLVYAVPASASTGGPPCNDLNGDGSSSGSEYAEHHISFLAQAGKLGNGPIGVHVPGVHRGFAKCIFADE